MAKEKSLLFVCIGNACRSQMAEGFARHHGGRELVVYSAGSRPMGMVIPETIASMKERGIDISRHYSKGLSEIPDLEFDAVVLMGCGDRCPTARGKRKIEWNIPDPIGQTPEFFRQTRDLIEKKVLELLKTAG